MTTTADLARAMALLGVEDEPLYLLRDHDELRGRAELYARVAAAAVDGCRRAEALAGLAVDDAADMHRAADEAAVGAAGLAALQRARIAWAQHTVERGRGPRPDPLVEAVTTTLGTVARLFEQTPPPDARLTDALLRLRDAADYLGSILREGMT